MLIYRWGISLYTYFFYTMDMDKDEITAWVILTDHDIKHIMEEMEKQTDSYNKLAESFGWKPLTKPCGLFYVRIAKDVHGEYYIDTMSFLRSYQERYRKERYRKTYMLTEGEDERDED